VLSEYLRESRGDVMGKLRAAVLNDQVWFSAVDVVNMVREWQHEKAGRERALEKELERCRGEVKVDSREGEKVTEFLLVGAAASVLLALADELDKLSAEGLTSARVLVK
jgi:hypothetical protein